MTNTFFENVGKLKEPYMEMKASHNHIYEDVRGLSSLICHYHLVQNNLSSRLLYKNLHLKICRITMLAVVLYESGTWYPWLRTEDRHRAFGEKKP
jgi:hypothetical protein